MEWARLIPDPALWPMVAFCVGLCIGSYLNAAAYRIPREISTVTPRSFCPVCGEMIPWRNNVPVLSWLLLRGKAECCGSKIHWGYPLGEFFTATMFALIVSVHSFPLALVYAFFVSLLVVGMITDFEHLIIPDRVTLGGALAGVLLSMLVPEMHGADTWSSALNRSLVGAAVGGGILWVVAAAGTVVFKREAMGQGDVKLLLCIGAFLGWRAAIFSIALGSILGAVAGIAVLFGKKERLGSFVSIPFGPPLMLAAILWTFGGPDWWAAYFSAFADGPDR